MSFRSGRANQLVTIQRATTSRDSYGQPIQTWTTLASWRCEVRPVRGAEYFAAQQFNAETSHKLTGHYISGVLPTDRVLFDSRVLKIISVINVGERGRELELMCKEVLGS